MKKILAFISAAAVIFACGCSVQSRVAQNVQDEDEFEQQTDLPGVNQEDLALPAINDSGSTTAPVVTSTTVPPVQTTQAPQPSETTPTTEPTPTTELPQTVQPSETITQPPQPSETTPTTQPTTQPAQTAKLLQSAVLQPINSGTYTITISAFLKDQSSDDKLSKIVRGGQTAYWITVPATGLTFKAFPSDGKYYLATPTKYCELTKSQYSSICGNLNAPFFDFSTLKFKRSETVREGLKKYTVEYFDLNGREAALWYSGNSLVKMQIDGESLPMTVSGSADSSYFTLGSGLEEVSYEELEPIINLSGVLF